MPSRKRTSPKPVKILPDWEAVRERLEEERQSTLPGTDTTKALQQFRLAWEAVKATGLETDPSGLIEQQARFLLLRDSLKPNQNG